MAARPEPHPVPSPPDVPWKEMGMNDKQFIEKKLGLSYPPPEVMKNALAYMKGQEDLKPIKEKPNAPNNARLSNLTDQPLPQVSANGHGSGSQDAYWGDPGSLQGEGGTADMALKVGDIVEWGESDNKAFGLINELDTINQQASVHPLVEGDDGTLWKSGDDNIMKDLEVLSPSDKKLSEAKQWGQTPNGWRPTDTSMAGLKPWPQKAQENAVLGLWLARKSGDPIKQATLDLAEGANLTYDRIAELTSYFDSVDLSTDGEGFDREDAEWAEYLMHGGNAMRGWLADFASSADNPQNYQNGDRCSFRDKNGQVAYGTLINIKNGMALVRLDSGGTTTVPVKALSRESSKDSQDQGSTNMSLPRADFATSGSSSSGTTPVAKTKNISLDYSDQQMKDAMSGLPPELDTPENRNAILGIVAHAASTGNFGTDASNSLPEELVGPAQQAAGKLIETAGGKVDWQQAGDSTLPNKVTQSPTGQPWNPKGSSSSGSGSSGSSGSGSSKGSGGSSKGSSGSGGSSGGSGSSGGGSGSGSGSGGSSGGGSSGGSGKGKKGSGSSSSSGSGGPVTDQFGHTHAAAGSPGGGRFVSKDSSGTTTGNQDQNQVLDNALTGLDPALDTPENRAAISDAASAAVNEDLTKSQAAIDSLPDNLKKDAVEAVGRTLEGLGYNVTRDANGVPTSVTHEKGATLNTSLVDLASDAPWSNFSQSDYSDEQWKAACILDTGSGNTPKERYKLPVREPGGALNVNACHAAASVLGGGRGGVSSSPEAKKAAANKLLSLYKQIGDDPPDSLLSAAGKQANTSAELANPDFSVGDKVAFTDEDGNRVTGVIEEIKDEGEDDGPEAVVELDESGEEIEIGLDKLEKVSGTNGSGNSSNSSGDSSNMADVPSKKAADLTSGDKVILGTRSYEITNVRKRGNRVHFQVKGKNKTYSYNEDQSVLVSLTDVDNPFAELGMAAAQMPIDLAEATQVGGNMWRKHILPFGKIHYRGRILDFSKRFAKQLVDNFPKRPFDQVPFFKVDSENRHNSDPENVRGEVKGLEMGDDGVYALLETNQKGTEYLKKDNPKLGTSVRVRFNWTRPADNKYFGPVLEHLAGTTLPHVPGLKPFAPADMTLDMSEQPELGGVEDLTGCSFEAETKGGEVDMAENVSKGDKVTFNVFGKSYSGVVQSISGNIAVIQDSDGATHKVPVSLVKPAGQSSTQDKGKQPSKEVTNMSDQELNTALEDIDLSQLPEDQRFAIEAALRRSQEANDLAMRASEAYKRERQARHEERVTSYVSDLAQSGVKPVVCNDIKTLLMDMSLAEKEFTVDLSSDDSDANEETVDGHTLIRRIADNFPREMEYGQRGREDLSLEDSSDEDLMAIVDSFLAQQKGGE